MQTPRVLIDPETFLIWLRNEAEEVWKTNFGFNDEEIDNTVNLMEVLFEAHAVWLYKMLNEADLSVHNSDVLQFPGNKSNPFKLVVDNTKDNGEV